MRGGHAARSLPLLGRRRTLLMFMVTCCADGLRMRFKSFSPHKMQFSKRLLKSRSRHQIVNRRRRGAVSTTTTIAIIGWLYFCGGIAVIELHRAQRISLGRTHLLIWPLTVTIRSASLVWRAIKQR